MFTVHKFNVVPFLPDELAPLKELAYNLYWTWSHEAFELFRRIDRDRWEEVRHNPVMLLGSISQERLYALAADDGFINHLTRVMTKLHTYQMAPTWYQQNHDPSSTSFASVETPKPKKTSGKKATKQSLRIAYFSAEFGLNECLPIYSGGLGILAGDHLKSASDLGIPLVGVGLLYQQGYFRQYLNSDGWQMELYPNNDFYNMPMSIERNPDGSPVVIDVEYPGRVVGAMVWRVQVGRVPLYLLDTNISRNSHEDRRITHQLYGGDSEMRIKQEIMLGIGGMHALYALKLPPNVCHMNEGHSAFLVLERIRRLMDEHDLSYEEARETAVSSNIFTTHTSVPAGIDKFSLPLVEKYIGIYYSRLNLSREDFLSLGRLGDDHNSFNMAVMALRMAASANGVSKLHGEVSRKMWRSVWPRVPVSDVPIDSITNGVHLASWVSNDMAGLLYRYIGHRWADEPTNKEIWKRVDTIPNEELWRTHERRRERLVAFARKKLKTQLVKRGEPDSAIQTAEEVLDPDALTIGFARRFATYKRADMIFSDLERLKKILTNKSKPVQLIFAGKAHPKDSYGKELIKKVVHTARDWGFRHRVVFIEDYDIAVAKYMVQGVDVWLNNPRMYQEASGTSGMKICPNGGLNLSILDGWWHEAFLEMQEENVPTPGWAIGHEEVYEDLDFQDRVESDAIYDLLEKDIVPLFYSRGKDGLPRKWIAKMKASMRMFSSEFRTGRMVYDYAEKFYIPSGKRIHNLISDDGRVVKELSQWKRRVREHWSEVRVIKTEYDNSVDYLVGKQMTVKTTVHLGALTPKDVQVQVYCGKVNSEGKIGDGTVINMVPSSSKPDTSYTFKVSIQCCTSGQHGYGVRVLPHHDNLSTPFEMGLIAWEE